MKGRMGTSATVIKLRDPKKKTKDRTNFDIHHDSECKWCKKTIYKGAKGYGKRSAPMHRGCFSKFKSWARTGTR